MDSKIDPDHCLTAPMANHEAALLKQIDQADQNILLIAKYALGIGIERGHDYFEGLRETTNSVLDLARKHQRLREHADKLASQLVECAGYIASVRLDRKSIDDEGAVYAAQTLEWAEGAMEIAAKSNALLEEHDDLENAGHEPRA